MAILKHPSGVTREAPSGFSWTCFLFGGFVPLLRRDWKYTLITLAIGIVGSFMFFIPNIVWWLVLSFKYNDFYLEDLKLAGYQLI